MAACGSLQHIFDKPLPESPKTIFDSLSPWNPLDFKEHRPDSVSVSSAMNSESLSMCTEGLGFESFYDVEELNNSEIVDDGWETCHRERRRRSISFCPKYTRHQDYYFSSGEARRRSRINGVEFPPPIPSLGRNGKPGVCFRSYRSNGRFILKEVRIPVQEFLHASREDGRLKLRLIQSDDEDDNDYDEQEDHNQEEGSNGGDYHDDEEEEG